MSKKVKIGPWGAVPIAILTDENIKPNMLKVYIALSAYQGTNGKCWPSRAEISRSTGIPQSAVSDAISKLVDAGWIERTRRSQNNATNLYHVLTDVQEIPMSEKPGYPENQDYRCPENQDIPLYNKNTKGKHQLPVAIATGEKEPSSKGAISKMKDPIADEYQYIMTADTPPEAWKSIPQERKNLNKLADLTRSICKVTGIYERDLIRDVIEQYRVLRRTNRNDFWQGAPFTPSALVARWDQVILALRKKHQQPEEVIF